MNRLTPAALAVALLSMAYSAHAQQQRPAQAPQAGPGGTLRAITVTPSADASAQGLSPAYPGGQVARGGRAGILGTRDNMETPFSITSYTNELIQDKQARSVGEVLQNDPSIRIARGFGNFQESYFIRGFILPSDDTAYNGLYGLLPRQYIATELFERVEVLRGASAFLNGSAPGGGGLGGAINLLPKRAPNEPLNRFTIGAGTGGNANVAADIARRFGPDGSTGVRLNLARRAGGTAVDREDAETSLAALGVDWKSRDVRLSADIGWQDNRLKATRPNVQIGTLTVPAAPSAKTNYAQDWSFSNERDAFGTFRGEWDLTPAATAWVAYGMRKGDESNRLANLFVTGVPANGDGTVNRFDNTREDDIKTGELGLRGKFRTGAVGHEWVASYSHFKSEIHTAFDFDPAAFANNLYTPFQSAVPGTPAATAFGGNLAAPLLTGRTRLASYALGDTMSVLNDSVLLTLGLRHQTLDIEGFAAGNGATFGRYVKSRTSPAVGAVWKATPQFSVYSNYIEGLSQGPTAGGTYVSAVTGLVTPVANTGQVFSPAVTKQAELGVKYDAGRIGGSAALFSVKRPRGVTNTTTGFFGLDGEDRHTGLEASVFGEVTRGFRLLGGATWLNAEQKASGNPAVDGNRVIGTPRFYGTFGAEWDLAAVRGLTLEARLVHTGSSFVDDANTLSAPGWNRLDVGARYVMGVQGKPLTLRARVDNFTNKSYWASTGGFAGFGYLVLGQPRTLTVSASVDF